jgi:hypothetical protein
MNKNTIIYAAIVVSMVMVGFIVFSGQQDFETQYTSLKASGELSKTVNPTKDVEVKYQTTAKPTEEKNKEQVKKREKYVEVKTMDASKTFEISVLNEQAWNESKVASVYVPISGKIDNSPFTLRVPSYLIADKTDVKIKIKNLKSGEEKTLFAPFMQTVSPNFASNKLTINSNDMSNYVFEQEQSLLVPGGPGIPPSLPSN